MGGGLGSLFCELDNPHLFNSHQWHQLISHQSISSVQSYHSKKYYAITMSSRPISTMSRHTISPICDHGGPPHSPKTAKNTPQTNRFSFLHLQVISVQSYHSKNYYAITMSSPSQPQNGQNTPQTNRFSFVHLQVSFDFKHFPKVRNLPLGVWAN